MFSELHGVLLVLPGTHTNQRHFPFFGPPDTAEGGLEAPHLPAALGR